MSARRPRLALLLILAFLAALLAPVRVSWSCPDGTTCVAERGERYVCAGGQCRSHASCCIVEQPCVCKHGALPGARPGSKRLRIEGPDHCRFNVSARVQLRSAAQQVATFLAPDFDLLAPSPPLSVPRPWGSPVWRDRHGPGFHPPPLLPAGPSRAPPTA
jgi:hypothetical protein